MPSRIIRESALTSESLDRLSGDAERMFWRLTLVADDHGRFEADPRVLLAKCFPLRVGVFTAAQVQALRDEIAATGTIELYEARGRLYGCFPRWFDHQRRRESKAKFPGPDDAGAVRRESRQVAANGPESPQVAAACGDLRLGAVGMEPREEGKDSVPHGTDAPSAASPAPGGAAPPAEDPKSIVFGAGLRLLTTRGVSEPGARSFLGKLASKHGDCVVAAAVVEGARASPVEPKAWLVAACEARSVNGDGYGRRHQGGEREALGKASSDGARYERAAAEAAERNARLVGRGASG
jgi:hypothetical protein